MEGIRQGKQSAPDQFEEHAVIHNVEPDASAGAAETARTETPTDEALPGGGTDEKAAAAGEVHDDTDNTGHHVEMSAVEALNDELVIFWIAVRCNFLFSHFISCELNLFAGDVCLLL